MPVGNHSTEASPERAAPDDMAGRLMESEHRGRYLWAAQLAKECEVLDAGCGTGYGTEILATAGARRVVGIDISQEAIDYALASPAGSVGAFMLGSLHELPFADGAFDLAVCFEVIEHLDSQQLAISELRRVLRKGGVLVISSPNRDVYPPGNPHHVHEFKPEELERALSNEFAHVKLYRQSPWLAAAVLDDEQSQSANEEMLLKTRKIASVEPGDETFTIAIASDAHLPTPQAMCLMGDPFELRWWESHLQDAERRLEYERGERGREQADLEHEREERTREQAELEHERKERGREQAELEHERKEQGRVLLEIEAELGNLHDKLAQSRAAEADLTKWATEQIRERDELLRRCEQDRDDFENRLRRAEGTIDDVTHSLSWRVTMPLRSARRVTGRR